MHDVGANAAIEIPDFYKRLKVANRISTAPRNIERIKIKSLRPNFFVKLRDPASNPYTHARVARSPRDRQSV